VKNPFRRAPRAIPCAEIVELVTDYLEGTLPEAERRALEHHLDGCEDCSSYLEQMRETRRIAGALGPEDVPEHDGLMAAFRAYQAERADE